MRIETYSTCLRSLRANFFSAIRQYDEDWNRVKPSVASFWFFLFSHSPVWWGLKHSTVRGRCYFAPTFQPFASMMRIETRLSVLFWAPNCPFQPFASMMRIETPEVEDKENSCTTFPAIRQYDEDWNLPLEHNCAGLWCCFSAIRQYDEDWNRTRQGFLATSRLFSAIRQYDEDWNCVGSVDFSGFSVLFSHSPVWWGLKPFGSWWCWLYCSVLFSHSPVWWGLKRGRCAP